LQPEKLLLHLLPWPPTAALKKLISTAQLCRSLLQGMKHRSQSSASPELIEPTINPIVLHKD